MRWDVFSPFVQQTVTAPPFLPVRGGRHEMLDVQYRGASSLLSFIHSLTHLFIRRTVMSDAASASGPRGSPWGWHWEGDRGVRAGGGESSGRT